MIEHGHMGIIQHNAARITMFLKFATVRRKKQEFILVRN